MRAVVIDGLARPQRAQEDFLFTALYTAKRLELLGLTVGEIGGAGMVGVTLGCLATLIPPLIAGIAISVVCGGGSLAFLFWEQGIGKRLGVVLAEVVLFYFLDSWGGWWPGTAAFLWALVISGLLVALAAAVSWFAEKRATKEREVWGRW